MPASKPLPLTAAGRAFLLTSLSGAELPTYRQFADNVGGMQNGNGPLLESIAAQCRDNGEPDLSVLVVSKETGLPSRFQGRPIDPDDHDRVAAWRQVVQQVRDYPWPDHATSPAALPAGEVLRGLAVPGLPGGVAPKSMLAMIKYDDEDGDESWAVRVTDDLLDDELLGILVGYVEHLKQQAAGGLDDSDPTRASG